MDISIIVAMDENRVIGADGGIPWHLPDDLKWFKRNSLGKTLIMGRRTYESIGRPLPGRTTMVVTRNSGFEAPGCHVCGSFDAALDAAAEMGAHEVVAAGGTSIYAAALPEATRIYMTQVCTRVDGDTYFPHFNEVAWREVWRENHPRDGRHPHDFTFKILERI